MRVPQRDAPHPCKRITQGSSLQQPNPVEKLMYSATNYLCAMSCASRPLVEVKDVTTERVISLAGDSQPLEPEIEALAVEIAVVLARRHHAEAMTARLAA